MSGLSRPRSVLPEEEYQKSLSEIIQRDYFPDLGLLEREDASRLPESTKNDHEAANRNEDENKSAARSLGRKTLTEFHFSATSEDNASLEQQMGRDKQTRMEKAQRLLEPPPPRPQRRPHPALPSPLPLASDDFTDPPWRKNLSKVERRDTLIDVPEPVAVERTANHQNQGNAAQQQALMPPPPAKHVVEYVSKTSERSIQPEATRFPDQPIAIPKPLAEEWDVSSESSDSEASTDLDDDDSDYNIEAAKRRGRKRKEQERETLVQMTPLLHPGASPITTWGTVGGTPLVLGPERAQQRGSAAPPVRKKAEESLNHDSVAAVASFRMPPISSREQAAEAAQARIAHRVRRSRQPPALSAAAKRLLHHKTLNRPMSARSASAFGSALRSSYTSAPRSARRTVERSERAQDTAYRATPLPSNKK